MAKKLLKIIYLFRKKLCLSGKYSGSEVRNIANSQNVSCNTRAEPKKTEIDDK